MGWLSQWLPVLLVLPSEMEGQPGRESASTKCRPHLWAPGEFQGTAFELQVGSPGSGLRLLAALPKVALVTGCCSAITPTGNLTLVEATQVGLVWRMARRVVAKSS